MNYTPLNYVFFLVLVTLIYILSRRNISEFFHVGRFLFRKESLSYIFVAMLFFPGTVLHEFAHALAATLLLLKVRSVQVFPHWEHNELRLGSVVYEKKDPVRSLFVGIAPIFVGIAFFWIIAAFKLFPSQDKLLFFLISYLIFAVSSTMFSSRQDLKDIIVALPILILLGGLLYILFGTAWIARFLPSLESFISSINIYLLFCLIIHIILLITFSLANEFIFSSRRS